MQALRFRHKANASVRIKRFIRDLILSLLASISAIVYIYNSICNDDNGAVNISDIDSIISCYPRPLFSKKKINCLDICGVSMGQKNIL